MVILVALYMKSICSSMDQLSKSNKNIAICLGATHLLRLNRGSTLQSYNNRQTLFWLTFWCFFSADTSGFSSKCIDCLCPAGSDDGSEAPEVEEDSNLADLSQTTLQKTVLWLNLGVIVIVAVGLYAYFSINPFTREQVDQLQSQVLNATTLSWCKKNIQISIYFQTKNMSLGILFIFFKLQSWDMILMRKITIKLHAV